MRCVRCDEAIDTEMGDAPDLLWHHMTHCGGKMKIKQKFKIFSGMPDTCVRWY